MKYTIDPFGRSPYVLEGTELDAVKAGLRHVYATPEMAKRFAGILRDEGSVYWVYGYNYVFITVDDLTIHRDAIYKED